MHHIGSQEVSEFDKFERERNFSSPMRIKDIFEHLLEDELAKEQKDWDNMSDDVYYVNLTAPGSGEYNSRKVKTEGLSKLEQKAHLSFDSCRRACRSLSICLQYRYYRGACAMGSKIKHGRPKQAEGGSDSEDRWMSGWDLEKIEAWVREHRECGAIVWPRP